MDKSGAVISPASIDYPSFPAEIRNKIMGFALRPSGGVIHPPYSRSGVQLLATNRQQYEDGHVMYYSDNIFRIPRSREELELLRNYQPKHLSLVRRVRLVCNILDAYEELDYRDIRVWWLPSDVILDWCEDITISLRGIWFAKFRAVSQLFPNLEELQVTFHGPAYFSHISDIPPSNWNIAEELWPFSKANWAGFNRFQQSESLTLRQPKLGIMLKAFETDAANPETLRAAEFRSLFTQSLPMQDPNMTLPILLMHAVVQGYLCDKCRDLGGWCKLMDWFTERLQRWELRHTKRNGTSSRINFEREMEENSEAE